MNIPQQHTSKQDGLIFMLAVWLLTFMAWSTQAKADTVTRITRINGQTIQTPFQSVQISANPGDLVYLSADLVDTDPSGNVTYFQRRFSSDFIWILGNDPSSFADALFPAQPRFGSAFSSAADGVNFRIPASTAPLVITVFHRDHLYFNGNDGRYYSNGNNQRAFQLFLTINHSPQFQNQLQPNSGFGNMNGTYGSVDPTQLQGRSFDFFSSLQSQGRWIYIGQQLVFMPNSNIWGQNTAWAPYQKGYWYWTSYGWTWQSFDPWGWITDHYGYWRHHRSYGWVWTPFRPTRGHHRWHPAVVSWFFTDEYIGWSPYWSNWNDLDFGYQVGFQHGYDDGYWDGFNAGLNQNYVWGHACVRTQDFLSPQLSTVVVTSNVAIPVGYAGHQTGLPYAQPVRPNAPNLHDVFRQAMQTPIHINGMAYRRYGETLGGCHMNGNTPGNAIPLATSRLFVEQRIGRAIAEVPTTVVHSNVTTTNLQIPIVSAQRLPHNIIGQPPLMNNGNGMGPGRGFPQGNPQPMPFGQGQIIINNGVNNGVAPTTNIGVPTQIIPAQTMPILTNQAVRAPQGIPANAPRTFPMGNPGTAPVIQSPALPVATPVYNTPATVRPVYNQPVVNQPVYQPPVVRPVVAVPTNPVNNVVVARPLPQAGTVVVNGALPFRR